MIAKFFLLTMAAWSAGLPSLDLPPEWLRCKVAADCAFAGDGCRSCGTPIVIHKKFLKAFSELDSRARKKAGVAMACEACSRQHWELFCEQDKCGAREKASPPAAKSSP